MSSFTPYEKANTLCISVLQNQSVSRSVSENKDRGFGRDLQLQSVRICPGFPYGLPIDCKLPAAHLLWRCSCEESGDFDRPAMKSVFLTQ